MKIILEIIISLLLLYVFVTYILFLENTINFAIGLFLFMPFSSFVIAPFMRIEKLFKFYSDVLVVQFPNIKVYDLHLASHYDLIVFAKKNKNTKRKIFLEIINGLLKICDEIEKEILPRTIKIRAVTFFLKRRTFERLGFKNIQISPHFALLYLFDYAGIVITNYFITKKFSFINIFKTTRATMQGSNLIENKNILLKLAADLENKV